MESWGSVVPELTFLNKPWDDLLLRPHSGGAFMPERLPLPLDIESLNKKHIFYDRARVQRFTHRVAWHSLSCQPVTRDPNCSPTPAHTRASSSPLTPFCRLWYHLPVRSGKSRDSAAARDTPWADFHVIALNGVLAQRCDTELLLDFWGLGRWRAEVCCRWHKMHYLVFVSQSYRGHGQGFLLKYCSLWHLAAKNNAPSVLPTEGSLFKTAHIWRWQPVVSKACEKQWGVFFLPSSLKNILLLILLLKMFYVMIESVFCSEMSVMGAVLLAQVNMQIWGSSSGLGSQSRAPQFRNSFSICN